MRDGRLQRTLNKPRCFYRMLAGLSCGRIDLSNRGRKRPGRHRIDRGFYGDGSPGEVEASADRKLQPPGCRRDQRESKFGGKRVLR